MQPFRTKGLFTPNAKNPPFGVTVNDPAAKLGRDYFLEGLRSPAPINWLANHLKEDQSNYGPVWIALRVLKSQAASATMKFYRWHPDAKAGGDEEEKKYLSRRHEICRFFHNPNTQDSGRKLVARMVEQQFLTGTALNWRVDQGPPGSDDPRDNKPYEMWNVQTGLYTAVPPSPMYPVGAYRIMPFFPGPYATLPGTWQAGGIIVPADHMLCCQNTHPLTYKEGLSPLAACSQELDTINSIGRARGSIMKRAPVPSGTVEIQSDVLFPDKPMLNRILAEIYNMIGGPDRAGKPAILGPGMKWVPSEIQGLELPWTESWNQLLDFVFAAFGVTKSMVGMSEESSYAALYAALKQFNLFSLCPVLDDIADAYNRQIIHKFWGEEYGMEFETVQVSDEDLLEKQLANDLQAGTIKMNEWRKIRKRAPLEGPEGDKLLKSGPAQQPGAAGQPGQPGLPGQDGQTKPDANDEPKNPAELARPRNASGSGSLPPRIASLLGPKMNGNGKH